MYNIIGTNKYFKTWTLAIRHIRRFGGNIKYEPTKAKVL